MEPLAQRLRPRTLDEVCGQQHLLGKNQVFRRTVESGKIPNMIFYGPSGVGKTTVASIIAAGSGMQLHKLNGTTASTSDIKSVLADIGTLGASGGILLYLDEIQYFNKRQQQSLLECVEQGTVTLIASTTENPYFYVYNALLSRCTVFEFKPLTPEDVRRGLENALHKLEELDGVRIEAQPEALDALAAACGGDMRKALGSLEFAVAGAAGTDGAKRLTTEAVRQVAQRSSQRYDKSDDMHYDCISALQKSIRGSDPDAAVHYLARILEAGDLLSACRRLVCRWRMPWCWWPPPPNRILPMTASMQPLPIFRPGAPGLSRGSCRTSTMTAQTPRSRASTISTRTITPTTGSSSNICRMPSRIGAIISPVTTRMSRPSHNIGRKSKENNRCG
mgnify:CR=1 FL=1